MTDLTTAYMGLKLKNPIIISSSGLTSSVKDIIDLESKGAGAIITKSLFEEEIIIETHENLNKMHASGFVYPETTEYFDFDRMEDTVSNYLKFLVDSKKSVHIPVIASVNCISAEGWTDFAKRIEDTGVDGLELNIFRLPANFNIENDDNEKIYFDIIDKITSVVKLPIALKIGFYHSNLGYLIKHLSQTQIKAIVLFNRFYNPDIDIHTLNFASSNVFSNPSEMSMSLRWIAIMANRVSCDLSASSGIHDGSAVIKQLLAGAKAIQLCSTLYKHGNDQIATILTQIEQWMVEKDYKTIDEFRGKMSQSRTFDPKVFERVQFMKYLRNRD
ncbi:MAG: dihydroorotate dehydrogenase-like protein [Bacteroidales bacterium]|nr:dihydroorotate dehydrogenase-like protein [Bacteroidales bacterium]